MIEAVLFDMDGVLIDSEKIGAQAVREALQEMGLPVKDDILQRMIGANATETTLMMENHYGPGYSHQQFIDTFHKIEQRMLDGEIPQPMPGVTQLLPWLKENGYTLAVASSTRIEKVKYYMEALGLAPYFTTMVGGDMVQNGKPAPDIFLKAAAEVGISPEDCLVVEDSYNGVRSASAAGCHTVMVPDTLPPTDEMLEKADTILPQLSLLPEYLNKLTG